MTVQRQLHRGSILPAARLPARAPQAGSGRFLGRDHPPGPHGSARCAGAALSPVLYHCSPRASVVNPHPSWEGLLSPRWARRLVHTVEPGSKPGQPDSRVYVCDRPSQWPGRLNSSSGQLAHSLDFLLIPRRTPPEQEHKHLHTHAHTHAHTQACACTHVHTHIHRHTYAYMHTRT